MKAFFEKIENLIAEYKEKLQEPADKKVQLSELRPGDVFETSFGEIEVLEHIEGFGTKVITKNFMKEGVKFDSDSPDFKISEIEKILSGEILEMFEKEFGSENIVEETTALTTVDMQEDFGTYTGKVRIITFDEGRKFNDLLVNEELPGYSWTMTPWSTKKRGWDYSLAVFSPRGYVNGDICNGNFGVRPVCILKSNIFVSKKTEQEEK